MQLRLQQSCNCLEAHWLGRLRPMTPLQAAASAAAAAPAAAPVGSAGCCLCWLQWQQRLQLGLQPRPSCCGAAAGETALAAQQLLPPPLRAPQPAPASEEGTRTKL